MTASRYFIKPDVFLCCVDYHWIALDLAQDKYFCFHRRKFDLLVPLLQGGATMPDVSEDGIPEQAQKLLAELVQHGFFTTDAAKGKPIAVVDLPTPTRNINPTRLYKNLFTVLRYLPAFLRAAARADYQLRRKRIDQTVRRVATRKQRRRSGSFPRERAEKLVLIFNALRPVYPRDYLCLFDSLALLEFLAARGVFPHWVFGASADPFKAHCWVQEGDLVLNDTLERANGHKPAMLV